MIPSSPHTIHLSQTVRLPPPSKEGRELFIDQKKIHSNIEYNGCIKITDADGKLITLLSPSLWSHITPEPSKP